jgi:hypothetical protein
MTCYRFYSLASTIKYSIVHELMLPRTQISKTAGRRIIIQPIREFLYLPSMTTIQENGLRALATRGSGIIDPTSSTAMARGALTSSTPSLPYQWLEGLRHHRPPASATTTAQEAMPPPSASSTPPSQARHHHTLLQSCAKLPS